MQATDGSSEASTSAVKKLVNEAFADVEGTCQTNGGATMFGFACSDALACGCNDTEGLTEMKQQVCCFPGHSVLCQLLRPHICANTAQHYISRLIVLLLHCVCYMSRLPYREFVTGLLRTRGASVYGNDVSCPEKGRFCVPVCCRM